MMATVLSSIASATSPGRIVDARARASATRFMLGPGVHQIERHGDDLPLEPGRARAHVALQRVLVGEEAQSLLEEGVVVAVAAVHRPGAASRLPDPVLLGRHLAELAQDLLAGAAAFGQFPVDAEPLGVGIEVEQVAHGLGSLDRWELRVYQTQAAVGGARQTSPEK